MNKKLMIILTISIICSLGLGLLVGYFIPIGKANSKTLSSNKDGNVSSLETPKYITNSDTFKQSKTFKTDTKSIDKNDKLKYPSINPKNVKFTPKYSDELTKNIEIIDSVYVEGNFNASLQVHAKNNNSISASIYFMLVFYDSNGKEVCTTYGNPGVFTFSNTEFAVELSLKSTKHYSSYEVIYYAREVDPKHQSFEEVKDVKYYIIQEGDGNINILFKNQTDHDISGVAFSTFLYKNGELVWANSSLLSFASEDIIPGTGGVAKVHAGLYNGIEYDDVKIVLTGAYKINK